MKIIVLGPDVIILEFSKDFPEISCAFNPVCVFVLRTNYFDFYTVEKKSYRRCDVTVLERTPKSTFCFPAHCTLKSVKCCLRINFVYKNVQKKKLVVSFQLETFPRF